MTIISGVFSSAYDLFGKMAPFLLFGYFFAGILHVFIKTKVISAHLGGNSFKSVLKAALFGVPLPLWVALFYLLYIAFSNSFQGNFVSGFTLRGTKQTILFIHLACSVKANKWFIAC